MIGRIKGILIDKTPPTITVDVQGIGYEIDVSMQTFYVLPTLNQEVSLFTQLIIREDAHLLCGFFNQEERLVFRHLIKVSGIGIKTALAILSALTHDELAYAIITEDIKKLSSVPGIGKKTAERMILELRGKLSSTQTDHTIASQQSSNSTDVINTLMALGYSEKEANLACKGIDSHIDVGEGVKQALKNLVR